MNWKPSLWASVIPRDPTARKPNHYAEMLHVAWENRDQLPFAWRILKHGVCDGCALGTTGLRDWTMDGIHLCMVRLELMRLNTASALDPERLSDVSSLDGMSSRDLRELGRLSAPMIWRKDERGFRQVSWDEAYTSAAENIRLTAPDRFAVYLTSRGMMNELDFRGTGRRHSHAMVATTAHGACAHAYQQGHRWSPAGHSSGATCHCLVLLHAACAPSSYHFVPLLRSLRMTACIHSKLRFASRIF